MSAKPNKVDPNYVSQRVLQTRKEIEQLKLELQKLINRGVESDKANTDSVNVSENKNVDKLEETKKSVPVHSSAHQNFVTKKPSTTFIPKKTFKQEEKIENSPKKVRHYNVEEAREYIRKQKEKRLENMKMQMKESQSVIDIRKEKLRELQKKSLELVQKNVNVKRDKSCSKEKKKNLPQSQVKKNDRDSQEKIVTLTKKPENIVNNMVPDLIINNVKEVPSVCSNINQNAPAITGSISTCNNGNNMGIKYSEIHHKAATKIQSYYRGYCQKKLYKKLVKTRRKKLNKVPKNIEPAISTNMKESNKDISNDTKKEDIPFWLQTRIEPYPYNFISAVKKKLNLATNSPVRTSSDIGVQISMREPDKNVKSKEEIKKAIGESLKGIYVDAGSYESHKCLNLNLKNVEKLCLKNDKIDNLKKNCDIRKHATDVLLKERHSKTKQINLLEIETSESDTSKDIPDISSETSISSLHSKSSHVSEKIEYNLEIDAAKFKKLKLKRRKYPVDDTIHILNDKPHKEEKILLREVPQITEYVEHLTENNQTDLNNILSQRLKTYSVKSPPEDKQIEPSGNKKSELTPIISLQKTSKSENNLLNTNNSDKMLSKKISKSENYVPTASDLISLKSNNSAVKTSNSESNVAKLMEPKKSKIESQSEIESDDNLKSFLEYMTSLENSKKSKSHRKSSSSLSSNSFKTLPNKSRSVSGEINGSAKMEKANSIQETYSSNFSNSNSNITVSTVPLLKRPSVTLTTSENIESPVGSRHSISIKPGEVKLIETKTNTNQIHLKFEAELHLLNDFNESLRQVMAVEKSILELHGKSQQNVTIYHNQDTQTTAPLVPPSEHTPNESNDTIATESIKSQISEKTVPTVNYRRGSECSDILQEVLSDDIETLDVAKAVAISENKGLNVVEDFPRENSDCRLKDKNIFMGFDLSQQLSESINSTIDISTSNVSLPVNDTSFNSNVYVGFSVGMFDQLIKDEDARIENLKTILKIREKALLDRTKGELAWLEIQKKHLLETGKVHEASLLKKKQRGIIIKLQHEKQEMQKLKQIQKAASKERKIILREQRNMIKAQLSNNTVPKIKRSFNKQRRHLGPVKVYNLHRETINTETSISRRSSVAEEIIITSRSESIVGQISEEACDPESSTILNTSFKNILNKKTEEAKKSLLMREAALQKRKKAAEDLLQWHQRLLEEERKIAELEMAANTIIKQVPGNITDNICNGEDDKYNFKGSQLNFLWTNMTGRNEKKFKDDETYSFNKTTLENFCSDSKADPSKKKHVAKKIEKNDAASHDSINSEAKSVEEDLQKTSISGSHSNTSQTSKLNSTDSIRSSNGSIIEISHKKSNSIEEKFNNNQDNTYSYSSEFDSPEIIDEHLDVEEENESDANKSHTEVLVNEIDRSKSTLNEIMQNISNITDEISAIYKLSSVANTIKDETILPSTCVANNISTQTKSTNDDIIRGDTEDVSKGDESEDDTLKSSAQSEIVKSLTELISSQNACQDIKSEQKHNIIETPEPVSSKNTLTDSQGTLESNIELCTNSNKLEDETNKIIGDENCEVSLHTDLNKELSQRDTLETSSRQENTDSSETKGVISVNNKSSEIINDLQKENNQSVSTDMCSINESSTAVKNNLAGIEEYQIQSSESISKSEVQNVLDLSYGFTGVRTKQPESTISDTIVSNNRCVSIELPTENGCNDFEIENNMLNLKQNSSVDMTGDIHDNEQVKSVLKINNKNNSVSDVLENKIICKNDDDNLNKSVEETTISTETEFEKSTSIDKLNESAEEEKIDDLDILNKESDNLNVIKSSSPIEISDFNNANLLEENDVDNLDEKIVSTNNLLNKDLSEKIDEHTESHKNNETIIDPNNQSSISDISSDSSISDDAPIVNDSEVTLNLEKIYDIEERNSVAESNTKDNVDNTVNVKKRVSEILADTASSREDKGPRLQDIYTTTYDILSPEHSPDIGTPASDIVAVTQLFDEEAEALFKKQLAIEQEIKQLELQQKEQIPYIYMREIPNKPPPPYTPPGTTQTHAPSVLPSSSDQLHALTSNISEKIFEAYENGNLENTTSNAVDEAKFLKQIGADKECYEFVFDLCKEFAVEHYKQFVERSEPSWMIVNKRTLAKQKPFNKDELREYLSKKVKEMLEFEKVLYKEKMITKWSRKKRDHVDELLVIESQAEESEWTNYEEDEVLVKNELTNDIMNMLLTETANVFSKIFNKKRNITQ